jgi:ABC-type glycerol-3-phosphate transport system substrate-binding protein
MRKRTLFFALIVSLTSVALLWGAGQGEGTAGTADSGEKIVLQFWFPSGGAVNDEYFNSIGNDFSQKFPDTRIETTVLQPIPKDIEQKLNVAKLGKLYPDIFSAFLLFIGSRGPRGDWIELDDYIDKWEGKDDIYPSVLEMGKYKGKIVGLGFFPAPDMWAYRKDFFAEAGLDPDKPPATWEELMDYAKKLVVRDSSNQVSRGGLDVPSFDPSGGFYEPFVRQNGGIVVDEVEQVPHFNDPEVIEAFEFLAELMEANVTIPHQVIRFDQLPFATGKSAIGRSNPSHFRGMLNTDPSLSDKLSFMPVMKRKVKKSFCGFRFFTIGKDSNYKERSWDFVTFMMSAEEMWNRYELAKIGVVRKSLDQQYAAADPINALVTDYVQSGKGKYTVPWVQIGDKWLSQAYEETVSGVKSADQALNEAQEGVLEELKRFSLD